MRCLMADLLGSKKGQRSPLWPMVSVSKLNMAGPKLHMIPKRTPEANGMPSMPTKLLSELVLMTSGS